VVPAVAVPRERLVRWASNFEERHGATTLRVEDGSLNGVADDGSTFRASAPFATSYDGAPSVEALAAVAVAPVEWGVLLVRKGGFAIARLSGATTTESKVGQRHVQGRTKAGGQSQQRFARRRDNQARQAYEAAADHAARILGGLAGPLVTGGDHSAVDEVLTDPRLRGLTVVDPWLAVPDPRRGVLEQAVLNAQAIRIEVVNR
jgi:hypothetical protein